MTILEMMQHLTKEEQQTVRSAQDLATRAHAHQVRDSGEPYITHPEAVFFRLCHEQADADTLAAAWLHDVVEDTDVTLDSIREQFGETIAFFVEGLTKGPRQLNEPKELYRTRQNHRLLDYVMQDPRIGLIKCCDRLHNIQTLSAKPRTKQITYANETVTFFVPLCEQLGFSSLQEEMEPWAFYFLQPQRYENSWEKVITTAFAVNTLSTLKTNLS
ncbi:HD domain-containing protein [Bacillus fonticola]|uniref:HD domain-containing protein n=1 Tax=Bacillus fonticola TaxID=2728853 RepID=UPI001474259E|nr:HD domain-containing protein [Bacillus fonticola]